MVKCEKRKLKLYFICAAILFNYDINLLDVLNNNTTEQK
jgi:hypothetical protein